MLSEVDPKVTVSSVTDATTGDCRARTSLAVVDVHGGQHDGGQRRPLVRQGQHGQNGVLASPDLPPRQLRQGGVRLVLLQSLVGLPEFRKLTGRGLGRALENRPDGLFLEHGGGDQKLQRQEIGAVGTAVQKGQTAGLSQFRLAVGSAAAGKSW